MGIASWVFLFLTCVFLPYLVVKSHLQLKKPQEKPLNYTRHIITALCVQGFMLVIALAAMRDARLDLFPPPSFDWTSGIVAGALLLVLVGTMPLRRKLQDPERRRRTVALRPHNLKELVPWTALSLAAGFVEEVVYRGVLMSLLLPLLGGNWWATVLVCCTVFAISHLTQGWVPAAFIFVFTIGLHWIVRETGNLYTAMILHATYDILAGVLYAFVLKKLDQAPEKPVSEPVTSGA
jgi:membrane protease YdiL (CAAX protease family)